MKAVIDVVCNDKLKTSDVLVYKNNTKDSDDIYKCRIARHHAEIIHIFGEEIDYKTDGFYTSYGRWVNRTEAAKIAIACGQCKEPLIMGNKLDSSDIF